MAAKKTTRKTSRKKTTRKSAIRRLEEELPADLRAYSRRVRTGLTKLEREIELFLELFAQPTVQAALRRFVESDDPMPYLPPAGSGSSRP